MKRQGVGRGFDIRDVRSWKRDLMGTIQCIFLITSLSMPCSVTLFLVANPGSGILAAVHARCKGSQSRTTFVLSVADLLLESLSFQI
jgi:hypothetical protein